MNDTTARAEGSTPADDTQTAEVWVPDRLDSVPATRAFLARLLDGWGVEDQVIADASLLATELMANAVKQGTGTVELRVEADNGLLHVAVHDDADAAPVVTHASPASTNGRGLWIVQSIAHDWGTESDGEASGKTVWFELSTLETQSQTQVG
jgi:anti-sigma regulatory factor (Ser/Thr protein kinase)